MKYLTIAISIFIFYSCSSEEKHNHKEEAKKEKQTSDPLPSWKEGPTKDAILTFVNNITSESSQDFIPTEDRVATFDNDGTLWSEQPVYFQLMFVVDEIKKMAKDHPEWETTEPYKTVIENDGKNILKLKKEDLIQLLITTHSDISLQDYEKNVSDWIATAQHPKFKVKYTEMVYQPMLELIQLLQKNEFKVYIVSGGGIDFMRVWAQDVYGIPKNQIIGSSLKSKFEMKDNKTEIIKTAEVDFIDDKEGKPVAIQKHIAKKPIFAAGNSDGDLQMLQYSADQSISNFQLIVHHTDSIREWAYDRNSHIGKLDKALDEAIQRNWTVVDMEKDWMKIYPFK